MKKQLYLLSIMLLGATICQGMEFSRNLDPNNVQEVFDNCIAKNTSYEFGLESRKYNNAINKANCITEARFHLGDSDKSLFAARFAMMVIAAGLDPKAPKAEIISAVDAAVEDLNRDLNDAREAKKI